MNALQGFIAFVGGTCTLLARLTGATAVAVIIAEERRSPRPRLSEFSENMLPASLLFILAAVLVALLTRLMVGSPA